MPVGTVKVEGLREFVRDVNKADGAVGKELKTELKTLAEPVRDEAEALGSRYAGIGPFKTGLRGGGAVVRQSKGTRSGLRGDFGVLQMRTVLLPALASREDEVLRRAEEWLDKVLGGNDL
ncbi:MAG: hypothetical protein IT175_06155 [Acidobacteria bacterium]|nr:hypothetical protein [Acidobacteriota bacterium]